MSEYDKPIMVVVGEGKVSATPDAVEIFCTISELQSSVTEAMKLHAQNVHAFLAALHVFNVEKEKIKTLGYHYGRRREWNKARDEYVEKGWEVVQRFMISTSVDRGGSLIEALSTWATVDHINFVVSNAEKLREDAVMRAMEDVKNKARMHARELGVAVKQIMDIEVVNQPYGPSVRTRGAVAMRASAAEASPEISAGETEITASVRVVFEIAKIHDVV